MTEGSWTFEQVQALVKRGDIISVRRLLDAGLDPNLKHRFGATILMVAAGYGRTSLVELLLARGARLNDVDKHGCNALADAALEGHVKTIATLLEHGASVKVSPHGVSLLTYASWGSGKLKTNKHFSILRAAGAS